MISIRRAVVMDSVSIAMVHVEAWQSAYAGILPDGYLARMSMARQAIGYERSIRRGVSVHVAEHSVTAPVPRVRIIGFSTGAPRAHTMGDGEIETLYVLDDWRDHGVGRGLMGAVARDLAQAGCKSAYCWVLRDNPSKWFYQRLGGREASAATVRVGGSAIPQTGYVWSPIDLLWAHAGSSTA